MTKTNLASLFRFTLMAVAATALAACGGGGGGSPVVVPVPVPDPLVNAAEVMQGFWSGSVTNGPDGATKASAVVMPDGTAWIALETSTKAAGVAKLALTGTPQTSSAASFSGNGSYYASGKGTQQSTTATGVATTAGAFTGSLTVAGNAAGNSVLSWTAGTGYKTAAKASDVVATWTGSLGGSALNITWTVNASGALTGSSTTGCTYAGTLKPSAGGIAVYDLSNTETCAGTTRILSGIATLAASTLNVVYTADAGAAGGLLGLSKAP